MPTKKTSHAVIVVHRGRVLCLERKVPYMVSDTLFRTRRRICSRDEREDILDYVLGRSEMFEDRFDFPKGRGSSIKDAYRELLEETGYEIDPSNAVGVLENHREFTYVGMDNVEYRLKVHVVFLRGEPRRGGRPGETKLFDMRWMGIYRMWRTFSWVDDYRGKYEMYSDILREIEECRLKMKMERV